MSPSMIEMKEVGVQQPRFQLQAAWVSQVKSSALVLQNQTYLFKVVGFCFMTSMTSPIQFKRQSVVPP